MQADLNWAEHSEKIVAAIERGRTGKRSDELPELARGVAAVFVPAIPHYHCDVIAPRGLRRVRKVAHRDFTNVIRIHEQRLAIEPFLQLDVRIRVRCGK